MNDKAKNIIADFNYKLLNEENMSTETIISFLDNIANNLNLKNIYICEATSAKNQFIYPYVTSGEAHPTMNLNLILIQDEDCNKLTELFKNGSVVLSGDICKYRRALGENNLAYGFVDNDICYGFVSFQLNENDNRIWNDEEKEIIKKVALSIKPLIAKRLLIDKEAYQNNISSTSVGMFYYYPKLKLIIVDEDTMEKYKIKNFVYRDSPTSFIKEIVNIKYRAKVKKQFNNILNNLPTKGITFKMNSSDDIHYKLSLNTNKYDEFNNPIQVMGLIELIPLSVKKLEERPKFEKIRDNFKKTLSDNCMAEFYVNLKTKQITLFKADNILKPYFDSAKNFDKIIKAISNDLVKEQNKQSFVNSLNSKYLYSNDTSSNSISITSTFKINEQERRIETIVLFNTISIYKYKKDAIVFIRDITDTEFLNYDILTGLLSINHFTRKVKRQLAFNKEYNNKVDCYFIYFDFVNFKVFNMEYGLIQGNGVLKAFANILNTNYKNEFISRYHDDNFVVFTNDKSLDNHLKIINNIVNKLNSINKDFRLNVKIGIYKLEDNAEPEIGIDLAQLACQYIKNDSKESYKIYDESLKKDIERKKYVVDHIDEAIKNNYLKVYYQPVVSTINGKLVSMEALSRWIDPIYGFLSPADFINVLEETNLIYKLDLYVMEQICIRLRNELDLNHKVVPISFNLSRNDFLSCKPFDELELLVKKYKLDRKYICIEITESIAINETKAITNAIDQFRNAGYEVWMDDFGSGYSSLNVLKDFNFDEIKIDMAFLKTFNDKSKTIVSSVISMAKQLNIHTLSEGVETKEHLDFLIQAGCERIQGYYYSKPLPYEELMNVLYQKHIEI